MVPFISGALLKEERCCKFMLTYDLKIASDNLQKI